MEQENSDGVASHIDDIRRNGNLHSQIRPSTAPGQKTLLDALYEEGIIPTYSFPKNVVSTYISGTNGKIKYQVERGLDVAIGEYAPGWSIVVDKTIYQIGGFFYPGTERSERTAVSPARAFIQDANYQKSILGCDRCGWFGLSEDNFNSCPLLRKFFFKRYASYASAIGLCS